MKTGIVCAFCDGCYQAIDADDFEARRKAHRIVTEHEQQCPHNPLVVEVMELRATVTRGRAALGCNAEVRFVNEELREKEAKYAELVMLVTREIVAATGLPHVEKDDLPRVVRKLREQLDDARSALSHIKQCGDTLSPQELVNVCCTGLGTARDNYGGQLNPHVSMVEYSIQLRKAQDGITRAGKLRALEADILKLAELINALEPRKAT